MKVLAVLFLAALASAAPQRAWDRIHGPRGTPRITGGQEVEPNSVPFQAALNLYADGGAYFCGGSLISEEYVMSAAHCCELTNNITVILGAHQVRNASEPTQQQIQAAEVTVHPGWDATQLINDICIIKLETPATINDAVAPGILPNRREAGDNMAGRNATATGWGLDSDSSDTISSVLRTVSNPVPTNGECRIAFGILGIAIPLHPTNVCLLGDEGRSTCSGDSGGPLTVPNSIQKPTIIGITSFGVSLGCEKGYPSVFTRVTEYLDWIQLITGIVIQN